MAPRREHQRRAITLSDVLIVIAIIALLLALLLPSTRRAREAARRAYCGSNLRQWGVALHMYREEYDDYLPTEGTFLSGGHAKPGTWYNELPPYLGLPSYRDFEGANVGIRDLPDMHVWICPSKNLSDAYKSFSGKNLFHYGMNQVLDGMGSSSSPSSDTPGFLDMGEKPLRANRFLSAPTTVYLFDIAPNSMAGSPRDVATEHYTDPQGRRLGRFHGNYANLLYITGGVTNAVTDDLYSNLDNRHGEIRWTHSRLYWGYRPTAAR